MKTTGTKTFKYSLLLTAAAVAFLSYAFSSGVTGKTLKNGDGCNCHGASASPGVNVVITGPAQINIGQTAEYTVTISGGSASAGGVNIASSAGTLTPVQGSGLQSVNGELTHTSPKGFSGGSVVFTFSYMAPSTAGTVTLFAVGNSVNLNGQNSGDSWNFAQNKSVEVTTISDVEDDITAKDFVLEQNYPNPFNPSTRISFNLPDAGSVKLAVYNALGDEIEVLAEGYKSGGYYTYNFDGKNLSSGIYFYRLISDNGIITRKMMLVK